MARGDLNASQAAQQSRGAAVSDRDIEVTIMRVLTTKLGLSERMVQDLQALTGLRGEPGSMTRPKAAVRRGDMSVIGRMQELQSKEATGAPTQAEFNALREDVRRVYEALAVIASAVK